jgi:hypothetical protein
VEKGYERQAVCEGAIELRKDRLIQANVSRQ